MQITRVEQFGIEELFANLRRVTLFERPRSLPYERADLTLLEGFRPDDLVPAQLYVKKSELTKITRLAAALRDHDVDLFGLRGWVRFWTPETPPEGIDLLPP